MNRLDGKVALITGGARGQGAAEAALFAAEGATVYITDVLTGVGQSTADELGQAVTFLHHDVTSESDWARVVRGIVEEHHRLDVLVNNAGIFQVAGMFDTSLEDWHRMIAINQTGVFLGLKTAGHVMREKGTGSIVNISSIAGLSGAGMAHAYSATKWAVRGMTKSAAQELAADNVRVNSVHPGIIETPMLDEFGPFLPMIKERIPMGRTASADEVANVVLFLASDESSYCTGHEFVVDGGMRA
ncbi:MAG TPA: glucose 1-dehydrogenase [Acidimicrobiales bacterium]|nr:glucose 1-dehydrogenase [Acidimicrobiales bacterium]